MNPNQQTVSKIIESISKSSSGIIVVPSNPSLDTLASATSLYLSLTKLGKTVSLVCSSPIKAQLTGADKFQNSLTTTGDNLVISFPYTDGAIDKVDYNIKDNAFNLIIAPRQGFPKLNPDQVKFRYAGGTIDFIITIDAPNLNALGQVYTDNQTVFQGREIINIDRHLTNGFFGSINFVNKSASSISELILKIIQSFNIQVDKDIASNLYSGLISATNNFNSYSVNADTFETASALLKLGAVKKPMNFVKPPSFSQKPIGAVEQEPTRKIDNQQNQDWLKPKIFKNGGLI